MLFRSTLKACVSEVLALSWLKHFTGLKWLSGLDYPQPVQIYDVELPLASPPTQGESFPVTNLLA